MIETILIFHLIKLEEFPTKKHTHVCAEAPIVYSRKMKDGDHHITLDNGKAKVVAEIVPEIPLKRVGKTKPDEIAKVCGIRRYDDKHKWWEIHPVTREIEIRRKN